MNAKELYEMALKTFEKRLGILGYWQEISENFFPERAHFTVTPYVGQDFASNLMTSYPLLVRRDLGNAFDTMLRPTGQQWFHMGLVDEEKREDNEAKRWMEWATGVQRRAMFDRITQFTRATKEGDHDFATFGQAVLQVEKAEHPKKGPHLLYRCWHLRDVAWQENRFGQICPIFRRWKPTARELMGYFKDVHENIKQEALKDPFKECDCIHMVVESDMYGGEYMGRKTAMPYVSIHYDCLNDKVMEAVGMWSKGYVIPRWQTVSGSQYAHSPATVAALPDARLIQSMTRTLLEAGEKAVNPPMYADKESVRSDISIYAGGITWVDMDGEKGDPIKLLTNDKSGIPIGVDMLRDHRAMLGECFFLSKLTMPQRGPEMTAYEVGQRVQEYIRNAMPLFAPMETEYNGALCEETFEQLFGPMIRMEDKGVQTPLQIPQSLRGADIQFRFESPLHDAIEKQKAHQWAEGRAIIADAVAFDPSLAAIPDARTALRDVMSAIWPAKWVNSEAKQADIEQIMQKQHQSQQLLETLQAAANVGATGAGAAKDMAASQQQQQPVPA